MTEPVENPVGVFTMTASGAVTGGRFVKFSGAQCDTAGEAAAGVAMEDAADGESFRVAPFGACIVTGGAALATVGTSVSTSAEGKAIAATSGHAILGKTLTACTGDGYDVSVLLGAARPAA